MGGRAWPAPLGPRSWQLGQQGRGPGHRLRGEARRSACVPGEVERRQETGHDGACASGTGLRATWGAWGGRVPLTQGGWCHGCWEARGGSGCWPGWRCCPVPAVAELKRDLHAGSRPGRRARPLLPCTPVGLAPRPSPAGRACPGRLTWQDVAERPLAVPGAAVLPAPGPPDASGPAAFRLSAPHLRLPGQRGRPCRWPAACSVCAMRGWTRWGAVGWEPGCQGGGPC